MWYLVDRGRVVRCRLCLALRKQRPNRFGCAQGLCRTGLTTCVCGLDPLLFISPCSCAVLLRLFPVLVFGFAFKRVARVIAHFVVFFRCSLCICISQQSKRPSPAFESVHFVPFDAATRRTEVFSFYQSFRRRLFHRLLLPLSLSISLPCTPHCSHCSLSLLTLVLRARVGPRDRVHEGVRLIHLIINSISPFSNNSAQ